jgi:DNA-directed RNA polymerase subunit beta'
MIEFLDRLKSLGFEYATKSGISISPFELEGIAENKEELLSVHKKEINKVEDYYSQGLLNDEELKRKKISI